MNLSQTVKLENVVTNEKLVKSFINGSIFCLVAYHKIGYIPGKDIINKLYTVLVDENSKSYGSTNLSSKVYYWFFGSLLGGQKLTGYKEAGYDEWNHFTSQIAYEIVDPTLALAKFENIELVNKQGKIAKRIAKYCYKTFQVDISKWVQQIAYLIRGYYRDSLALRIEIDQDYDSIGNRECDDDYSCIFTPDGCNHYMFYRMASSDAHVIRIYQDENLIGRALLFKSIDDPENWVMINGYGRGVVAGCSGDTSTIYRIAPYVAQVLDKKYQPVVVKSDESFWINLNRGIVFYSKQEECSYKTVTIEIVLDSDEWYCEDCGNIKNSNDTSSYSCHDGRMICDDCYDSNYFECQECGEIWHEDYMHHANGDQLCDDCFEKYHLCSLCDKYVLEEEGSYYQDDFICDGCSSSVECGICDKKVDIQEDNGLLKHELYICSSCLISVPDKTREEIDHLLYSSMSYRNITIFSALMNRIVDEN
jgi:hypothetical protein